MEPLEQFYGGTNPGFTVIVHPTWMGCRNHSAAHIWEIGCWTFGPTQNFKLVSLAPEASGILLSLNSSFVQLGFAAGAGIEGITVGSLSIMDITWISSIAVLAAWLISFIASRLSRHLKIIIKE